MASINEKKTAPSRNLAMKRPPSRIFPTEEAAAKPPNRMPSPAPYLAANYRSGSKLWERWVSRRTK